MCSDCTKTEETTEEQELETCDCCTCEVESTTRCRQCWNDNCDDCFTDCTVCSSSIGECCRVYVSSSQDYACPDCVSYCDGCDEYYDSDYMQYSEYNDCYYCESCYNDHDCEDSNFDLDEIFHNPRVFEYHCKAEKWKFIKQPWENTTYLGVELEIELEGVNKDAIFEISNNHLKGLHAWKMDGSLKNGMELVITPHTLQSLKKLDFRSMLTEIKGKGCTSADNGTCGMHVHVSKDSLAKRTVYKLKRFFVTNREFIESFSNRTSAEFNRWCNIPEDPTVPWGRCAISGSTGKGTVEFRLFNGTLDPKQFAMNLVFVQALVDFARFHGIPACSGENSLKYFKEYVDKNYSHLGNYINKHINEG